MLICKYCGKEPNDINEFVRLAKERHCTPEQAVTFDGTYDGLNQRFICTQCFVSNHRNIGGAQ